MMTYIVIHIICSIAAYHLFKHDWRKQFDWTLEDKLFGIIISMGGPTTLCATILFTLASFLQSIDASKIIDKKYERK